MGGPKAGNCFISFHGQIYREHVHIKIFHVFPWEMNLGRSYMRALQLILAIRYYFLIFHNAKIFACEKVQKKKTTLKKVHVMK